MKANTSPMATPCSLRRRTARSKLARSDSTIFARGPEQFAGDSKNTLPDCRERLVLAFLPMDNQLSAVSCQLSAVSFQLSAFSFQLSAQSSKLKAQSSELRA